MYVCVRVWTCVCVRHARDSVCSVLSNQDGRGDTYLYNPHTRAQFAEKRGKGFRASALRFGASSPITVLYISLSVSLLFSLSLYPFRLINADIDGFYDR